MDNPDPCRDLHRPRDQRLPAGRVLIRNPVLRDPREERARHRARANDSDNRQLKRIPIILKHSLHA